MEPEQIRDLIEQKLPNVNATVKGDGSHFDAIVIGDCFAGQSMLQQQKMVYAALNDKITSGELHAISIKTYTPDQWEKAKQFQVGGA